MSTPTIEHTATIWLVNDPPTRMVYAGRRWRVTDTPTRLRHASWSVPLEGAHRGLYGWRFQGADSDGVTFLFDVYKGEEGWHVQRTYE